MKLKQTSLDINQKHLSKDTLEKLKDPRYLRELHHIQKKTLTEIAKELGLANCSSIKYNIPILTHFLFF